MRSLKFFLPGIMLGLIITISSYTKNDDNINAVPVEKDSKVNITMVHMVTNSFVEFDKIQYINTFGNLYSVATLKYFISDIYFHKSDGTSIYIDDEFYVDARDQSTLTFMPETKIPAGDYTSISFIFGISESKNIDGAFPDSPENAMEWPTPLGGGYHYMKLEGKVDSSGVFNNFQAHTGPTFGNSNFVNVSLPVSAFSTTGDNTFINIIMDINKWWTNPNTLDLNEMTMVMGNQEMQEKLKANGEDVFTVEIIE